MGTDPNLSILRLLARLETSIEAFEEQTERYLKEITERDVAIERLHSHIAAMETKTETIPPPAPPES